MIVEEKAIEKINGELAQLALDIKEAESLYDVGYVEGMQSAFKLALAMLEKPTHIFVTAEHIKEATNLKEMGDDSFDNNPVALALLSVGYSDVVVGSNIIRIGDRYFRCSKEMYDQIEEFAKGDMEVTGNVEPFEFDLTPL